MRKASCIAACLTVLTVSQAFADRQPYFGNVEPPKEAKKAGAPATTPGPVIQQGGDTVGSATVIPAIPYGNAGTTIGYANDYNAPCAFAGNTVAPDVVYSYTPTVDQCVDVSLCESSYDTILMVLNSALTIIGCNDDADCDLALRSRVEGVNLVAGQTYYIIVDGWSTSAGEYVLEVTECPPPCVVTCPPGAFPEGEPNCGIPDTYNGGCNSTPNVFTSLVCNDAGVLVCGTYGAEGGTRDTDWYEIVMDAPGVIQACITGQYPSAVAILNPVCPVTAADILDFQFGPECVAICATANVGAGTYRIFAGVDGFDGFPCLGTYVLRISGYNCPPVGVEAANWSGVKSIFR
jgi:hypothetical protein